MYSLIFEWFLIIFSYIFDALTVIPYYFIERPYEVLERSNAVKAVSVDKGNPAGPYRNVDSIERLITTPIRGCHTIVRLYAQAVDKFRDRPSLGIRKVIKDENEVQPNGKVFKKTIFGKYEWQTYSQVDSRVTNFAHGILNMDLGNPDHINVCIFSETCAHWTLSALACFLYKLPMITLYATLGEEAIMYGLVETDVNVIITSVDGVAKFKSIHTLLPKLKAIIYFDGTPGLDPNDSIKLTPEQLEGFTVPVKPFSHVESLGDRFIKEKGLIKRVVKGEDLALIMYTSGSTGNPKGVMISHLNLTTSLSGAVCSANVGGRDTYPAYLPQAHILELLAELACFVTGARIGFSSPTTLTDHSTRIKKGTKGDVSVLKPTLMAMVPAIMDRIYKSVWDKVNSRNPFRKVIFNWAYHYKKKWYLAGYSTPLVNLFVFKRVRTVIMGGHLRMMLCGSAPLSEDTQLFMNIVFCCSIGQGYGLTETGSMGTVQTVEDMSVGRVGVPLTCNELKLVPWEEGGYNPSDKPYPRGEVWIGGGNITMGYYKNPEKTKEDYKEEGGQRWFATGDIGLIEPDGCLRIVDRKKDLVKLQAGEYVSLGKVEVVLKMSKYVDHMCVCALPFQQTPVALVMPNPMFLIRLANELKLGGSLRELVEDDWLEIVDDEIVLKRVLDDIQSVGRKGKLQKFEIPSNIKLVKEQWTAIDGFVTESFKLKRKYLDVYYAEDIKQLYADSSSG